MGSAEDMMTIAVLNTPNAGGPEIDPDAILWTLVLFMVGLALFAFSVWRDWL